MKTIDISPPKNLSNQFRFQCIDTKGKPVPPSIPQALLDFTPSGNFSSQHVGMRFLTVGHFPDVCEKHRYFVMFNIVGTEADCLNRQGQIWSSALVSEEKQELITYFLDACKANRLAKVFPCLQKLTNLRMHSGQFLLKEAPKSNSRQVKKLIDRLQASQAVTLSSPESFWEIYQTTEYLVFNSFRFHDFVGCSFNGVADNVFDLCIINGKRNSLANYTSANDPWLKSLSTKIRQYGKNWGQILLALTITTLILIALHV